MNKAQSPRTRGLLVATLLVSSSMLVTPVYAKSVATPGPTVGKYQPADRPGSFADLVDEVRGAVVRVQTESTVAVGPRGGAPWRGDMEDFFERFFERGGPQQRQPRQQTPRQFQRQRKARGEGSGFVISADGFVVTNHHVIEDADDIELIFDDGSKKSATLVGSDPKTDLAVLKIETSEPLSYVEFGSSDTARVGDWILAIGNPFGLGGTATTGIISARGRNIQSGPFDDYIQIDAPINRGNSGGPLFDTSGRVIGINTAIYSPNGGNVGIGFAVPTSLAEPIIAQLRETGGVSRGWLGVMIQEMDEALADSLGLDDADGALIADVQADSPAGRAGIQQGDVIREFAGVKIESIRDLTRAVANQAPDSRQSLKVWRNEKLKKLKVTLGNSPGDSVAANDEPASAGKLGVRLQPLTEELRAQLDFDADVTGALVSQVEPGSPAEEQGLRRGDLITQVNQQQVTQVSQVADAVAKAANSKRRTLLLLVQRGDNERFVAVKVG